MNSAEITRKSKSNFSWAFIGLEKSQRVALEALYAFCREVDDIVDETKDSQKAQDEINLWRERLDRIHHPSVYDLQISHDLSNAITQFPIQVSDLRWILDGVEMDLHKKRYETFDELLEYCDGVATAVGFATMAIFGADRKKTERYTYATGRALQLTNILRDVGVDAQMGRIYLPQEDMQRFGCSERDLTRTFYVPSFLNLMKFEAKRAESFYIQADQALTELERSHYPAPEVMRSIYHALLGKIEAQNFQVLRKKIKLSKPKKLWIALSIWAPHFFRKSIRSGNT